MSVPFPAPPLPRAPRRPRFAASAIDSDSRWVYHRPRRRASPRTTLCRVPPGALPTSPGRAEQPMTHESPSAAGTAPADLAGAIDPRLVVVSREPFNAETPLGEQIGLLTPNRLFYARNHFAVPRLAASD